VVLPPVCTGGRYSQLGEPEQGRNPVDTTGCLGVPNRDDGRALLARLANHLADEIRNRCGLPFVEAVRGR